MCPGTSIGKEELMGWVFSPLWVNHNEKLCKTVVLLPSGSAESTCFTTYVTLLILHFQSLQTPQTPQECM